MIKLSNVAIIAILLFSSILLGQQNNEMQNQIINEAYAPQAPSSSSMKFKGLSKTLLEISSQIDASGTEFGVMDFKPATDDPDEPDSIKHRLWKDPDLDLVYGGNFRALGDIIADKEVSANTVRIRAGAGPNKVLTSIGTSGLASWQTLAASGSINGLSDGKAISNTGSVYLGEGAGTNDDSPGTTDPSNNTGFGINALNKNGLVASQRGEKNTAIGFEALKNLDNNNGDENSALGFQAHLFNESGAQNTAIGSEAMSGYSGGDENIAIGYQALKGGSNTANGHQNIAIGVGALNDNISGDNNIAIGYNAGFTHTGDDQLFIQNRTISSYDPLIWGRFAPGIIRLQVNAENASTTNLFYVNGSAGGTSSWSGSSDKRLKKSISSIDNSLNKVLKLRGVNFEWKDPENHRNGLQMGFIAQEALKVIPEVVDSESEYMSMQYAPITALLVEAMKEQQEIIDNQNKRIADQEERLQKLENLIEGNRFTKISN